MATTQENVKKAINAVKDVYKDNGVDTESVTVTYDGYSITAKVKDHFDKIVK